MSFNEKEKLFFSVNSRKMYERIKESFGKQGLMQTLNARLLEVEKDLVKISCEFSEALTPQHGFFHAGVLTSIVDSACGMQR